MSYCTCEYDWTDGTRYCENCGLQRDHDAASLLESKRAAAEEMYAALKLVQRSLHSLPNGQAVLDTVNAALDKAEGK